MKDELPLVQQQILRGRYWLGGKRKAEQDRFFKQALDSAGWQPGDAEQWDACWFTGMPEPAVFLEAGPDRKVNHIPGSDALTLKSRLYEVISALRHRQEERFGPDHDHVTRLDFVAPAYSMPRDYHALQQAALDDPDKRWILKPKNLSRGRGIRVLRDVADVPLENTWMVQQYLENVHTMKGRKYVLRLYVLISSITPLRVYLYRQGFAKLASAPYDTSDYDNVYSHLTNPDINALNADADVPVEFVDLDRYRQWLREQGHDDRALFDRVRDLVTLTAIAAVESMRERTRASGVDARGCYELLGLDCLIDEDLKPWILECNLSPSMEVCARPDTGGRVEERIKGQLVADMAALVGLTAAAPEPDDPDDRDDPVARIRQDAESELARAGGFERVCPGTDVEDYLSFFPLPRLADTALADAVSGASVQRPRLQPRFATATIAGDQLLLYDVRNGQLSRPNPSASFIWLMAMEGMDPDRIAERLLAAAVVGDGGSVPGIDKLRQEVWDCLADWAHRGLLMQRGTGPRYQRAPEPTLRRTPFRSSLRCGALELSFHTDSEPVVAHLEGLLRSLEADAPSGPDASRLEVVRDSPGYTVVLDGEVVAPRLTLAALEPALMSHLIRRSAGTDQMVLDAARVTNDRTGSLVFANDEAGVGVAFARYLAQQTGGAFSRGVRLGPPTAKRHTVILAIQEDSPRGRPLETMPMGELLEVILPMTFAADGAPLDADQVARLAEWLQRQACYRLAVTDYRRAADTLTGILSHPQHDAHAVADTAGPPSALYSHR
jgi:hypothetical protein